MGIVRQICVNFCNNHAFLCTSMKLGKLAECYPINNIRSGAILNLTVGDLYEFINLIIMYTIRDFFRKIAKGGQNRDFC